MHEQRPRRVRQRARLGHLHHACLVLIQRVPVLQLHAAHIQSGCRCSMRRRTQQQRQARQARDAAARHVHRRVQLVELAADVDAAQRIRRHRAVMLGQARRRGAEEAHRQLACRVGPVPERSSDSAPALRPAVQGRLARKHPQVALGVLGGLLTLASCSELQEIRRRSGRGSAASLLRLLRLRLAAPAFSSWHHGAGRAHRQLGAGIEAEARLLRSPFDACHVARRASR